jgi:hypothetical protein
MDATRIDAIARLFAARRSRRAALAGGGAGLAAAALAATGRRAAAQVATPPPAGGAADPGKTLFVQSFESGAIAPKAGVEGTYTLTLDHGLGQTLYFTDRPERVVGASPTAQFLKGLGFPPDNPPNAALVVEASPGNEDIAVVELTNARYDAAAKTATYDAKVLEDWERTLSLGFAEAPTDLARLAPAFGAAHLFIDGYYDCSDWNYCYTVGQEIGPIPGGPVGTCWSWSNWQCKPSNPNCNDDTDYAYLCDKTYAACDGGCFAGA